MDKRNDADLEKMKQIAASGNDEPLLMLNLNRYIVGEYPNGNGYTEWRKVNKQMLDASAANDYRMVYQNSLMK